jgi:hypothetical protein
MTIPISYEGHKNDRIAIIAWVNSHIDYAMQLPPEFVCQYMHFVLLSLVETRNIAAARGIVICDGFCSYWISFLGNIEFVEVRHPHKAKIN